jgi:adenylate cyclase
MWGAPSAQPDHAQRACRAGVAMLQRLPELDARWQSALGEPLGLGIGINTGTAHVGNMGTRRKFKYGPLGNTVNLASRVQGVTKYFKVKMLISHTTHKLLSDGFCSRRLGKVRVVNIDEPVELYELVPPGRSDWPGLQATFDEALTAFEHEQFARAARAVGNYLAENPGDGPSLMLLARVANALADKPVNFDPVWVPLGK